jgi:dTDP-4-amino-4,6-dideoxygalactose transaminase
MNFRINEILSAILRVQLTRLDGMLDAMLTEKRLIIQALEGTGDFTFNPIHDVEGDCGTTVAMMFSSETRMREVLANLQQVGVSASTPIDSGKHVYTNWDPILNQRGSHNPALDAYQLAQGPVDYSADMCPQTLNTLARTIFLYTDPTRSREDLDAMIEKVKKAI